MTRFDHPADFLLVFNSRILPDFFVRHKPSKSDSGLVFNSITWAKNAAPLRATSVQSQGDLDCDLAISLKVKSNVSVGLTPT